MYKRQHLEGLQDVDIASIIQALADYIDSNLDEKEIESLIKAYIAKHSFSLKEDIYEEYEERIESSELLSTIDSIIEDLKRLRAKVCEIDRKKALIAEKIARLMYRKGYIERKAIRGKNGKVYFYYYLRYWENGKKRSIYVGKEIPERVNRLLRNYREFKLLIAQLRELDRELQRIERAVESIDRALWGLM